MESQDDDSSLEKLLVRGRIVNNSVPIRLSINFESLINWLTGNWQTGELLLTFSLLKTYVVVSISTIVFWLGRMLEEQS